MSGKLVQLALPALQKRAAEATHQLLKLAARYFGMEMPQPTIQFDLRGQAAGQVKTWRGGGYLIRYNAQLLARNGEGFLSQTVPHETAHLVAYRVFGSQVRPHGHEWQAIMKLFSAAPTRCHTFDVEGLKSRSLRLYDYRCACGTRRLTSIRHNRIEAGRIYICRSCGRPLKRLHFLLPMSEETTRSRE